MSVDDYANRGKSSVRGQIFSRETVSRLRRHNHNEGRRMRMRIQVLAVLVGVTMAGMAQSSAAAEFAGGGAEPCARAAAEHVAGGDGACGAGASDSAEWSLVCRGRRVGQSDGWDAGVSGKQDCADAAGCSCAEAGATG